MWYHFTDYCWNTTMYRGFILKSRHATNLMKLLKEILEVGHHVFCADCIVELTKRDQHLSSCVCLIEQQLLLSHLTILHVWVVECKLQMLVLLEYCWSWQLEKWSHHESNDKLVWTRYLMLIFLLIYFSIAVHSNGVTVASGQVFSKHRPNNKVS
jgi:hypothetical protein